MPGWVKIVVAAGIAVLLLVAAVLSILVTGEPPEYARAAAIQARFADQLGLLRDLTETCPLDPCAGSGPSPVELAGRVALEILQGPGKGEGSPARRAGEAALQAWEGREEGGAPPRELLERIETLQAWIEKSAQHADRFADRAILGAELIEFCAGGRVDTVRISQVLGKEYHEPILPLSRALFEAPAEWPVVTLWYFRDRRVVRYEDRFPGPSGSPRGFRLLLDLESLASPAAPADG